MKNCSYLRYLFAGLGIVLLVAAHHYISNREDLVKEAGFTLVLGATFGVLLQRSRFCFFCILRDFFEKKNGAPLTGILVALITGSIGYLVLFGTWVPDPGAGYLPQDAHIGPVSWHLLAGGLAFGWGMVLSGSCVSAHLYRLGEGSVEAPIALLGTGIGFLLGFKIWNALYVTTVAAAPVLWIPAFAGYGWIPFIQILFFATLIIWLLVKFSPATAAQPEKNLSLRLIGEKIFVKRWPEWLAGIGIGVLGFFSYLRVGPLGVTSEIGRQARKLGNKLNIIPAELEGLDGFSGCRTDDTSVIISSNGIFILALIAGSLIAALLSGHFRPRGISLFTVGKTLLGGVLLGLGAMISLGCTIGNSLSGISAFAVSGWLFTIAMIAGVWSGLKFFPGKRK